MRYILITAVIIGMMCQTLVAQEKRHKNMRISQSKFDKTKMEMPDLPKYLYASNANPSLVFSFHEFELDQVKKVEGKNEHLPSSGARKAAQNAIVKMLNELGINPIIVVDAVTEQIAYHYPHEVENYYRKELIENNSQYVINVSIDNYDYDLFKKDENRDPLSLYRMISINVNKFDGNYVGVYAYRVPYSSDFYFEGYNLRTLLEDLQLGKKRYPGDYFQTEIPKAELGDFTFTESKKFEKVLPPGYKEKKFAMLRFREYEEDKASGKMTFVEDEKLDGKITKMIENSGLKVDILDPKGKTRKELLEGYDYLFEAQSGSVYVVNLGNESSTNCFRCDGNLYKTFYFILRDLQNGDIYYSDGESFSGPREFDMCADREFDEIKKLIKKDN